MRTKHVLAAIVVVALTWAVACSNGQKAAQQTKDNVQKSLQQAGLKDVNVDSDAEKRVITLNGKVKTPEDKEKAESAARSAANGWVVANQVSIEPEGQEAAARKIEGNIDEAIEKTYESVLIANHLDKDGIKFKSKNGVLTLEGKVKDANVRSTAEQLGSTVPHVAQVVNKIDVKK